MGAWGEDTRAARLEEKSMPEPNSGCIFYTGSLNRSGYGEIRHQRRTYLAHRAAWELERGPIPDGFHVLHKCDVPCCINVQHLFLGTDADNMADKTKKGRQQWGERVPQSILTEDQVRAIRVDTRGQRAIAADYGVSITAVSDIKTGRRWHNLKS